MQEARDSEPMVARLLEIARKLEGLYRHASTHAAGMVIGDRPLDELVPLYRDPKSSFPITQFNWKLVEQAGLVKFDFLGLKTLTVLQKALELIKRGRGIDIDLLKIPLDDRKTFELLAKADTVGVFQLEGAGVRESLKRLKPDRFEDIMAMTALYRPGPMDNIPTYINRKHGEEPVDCLHPMLEPILKETHGVIIYQEQVLQIAQVMAGYSLGQADILRKAMGKKDKAIMAKQQAEFVAGAVKKGVAREEAAYIFELVDKFAGYGFNKAHTAAYAHVAYYTAYLKANHREQFLAASMTLDAGNTDKLALFAAEAVKSGIKLLPPCINASEVDFLAGPGTIRYSLAALKNIGAQAVESIVAERAARGPFKSLSDFAARLNAKTLNKRALEHWRQGRRVRQPGAQPRPRLRQRRADAGVLQPAGGQCRAGHGRSFRGRRHCRATANRCAPPEDLDADGAPAVRVRGGWFLPLRAPDRRLQTGAGQARHLALRRDRVARRSRLGFGSRRGNRRLRPRAPLPEGQQVRLRSLFHAHGPVRMRGFLRRPSRPRATCSSRHAGAGLARRRARWRHAEVARPGRPVAGRGGEHGPARAQGGARPARHPERQRARSRPSRRC